MLVFIIAITILVWGYFLYIRPIYTKAQTRKAAKATSNVLVGGTKVGVAAIGLGYQHARLEKNRNLVRDFEYKQYLKANPESNWLEETADTKKWAEEVIKDMGIAKETAKVKAEADKEYQKAKALIAKTRTTRTAE